MGESKLALYLQKVVEEVRESNQAPYQQKVAEEVGESKLVPYLQKVAEEVGESERGACLGLELLLGTVSDVAGHDEVMRGHVVAGGRRHRFLVAEHPHHPVKRLQNNNNNQY